MTEARDWSLPHSPAPTRNDVINTTPIEISVDRFQVSAGLVGLGCVESSLAWDRAAATATVTTATAPLDVATSRPAIIETAAEAHVPSETNGAGAGVFSVWSGSVRDEDPGEEWIFAIYIYTHTHTHIIDTHTHTHTHTYTLCVCVCVRARVCVCACVCMYTNLYTLSLFLFLLLTYIHTGFQEAKPGIQSYPVEEEKFNIFQPIVGDWKVIDSGSSRGWRVEGLDLVLMQCLCKV